MCKLSEIWDFRAENGLWRAPDVPERCVGLGGTPAVCFPSIATPTTPPDTRYCSRLTEIPSIFLQNQRNPLIQQIHRISLEFAWTWGAMVGYTSLDCSGCSPHICSPLARYSDLRQDPGAPNPMVMTTKTF